MRNQPSITTRPGHRFGPRGIAEICGRALSEYAEASAMAHVHPFARLHGPGGDR